MSQRRAAITALGIHVPERVVTNADLEKIVDTSDEWIRTRTGIHQRHVVEKGTPTSVIAALAAQDALQRRGIGPDELDLIVVGTVTPDMLFPATACLVQDRIGSRKAWGFDVSAACSGFVYALTVGAQFVQTGVHRKVLVIGADVMTSIIDYTDRSTCVLFGDAAGAVLLEPRAGQELERTSLPVGKGVVRAQAGSQASGREVEAARARLNLTQARLREARANAERLNRDRDRQDLRLFKERTYATAVALITAMGFGLYASLVLMPVLLQTLMRYPALQAGFVMAPRGLGSLVVMPFVGIAIEKTDPRRIIGLGFLVNAVTMYWLGMLNLNAGFWDFFWPQFIQGAGLGLLFVPLTTVAMDRIRPEAMGAATSLFNLLRNIGGSVGIATVQTLLARYRQTHGNVMVGHVDAYSPASQILFNNLRSSFMAAGADVTTATQRAYAALYGMVQQQAAMLSFIDGFKLLAVVFLLLVPFVALMRKPQHHGRNR